MAYDRLEPIGPAAEQRRWAEMMALLASVNSKRKYSPEEFLPKWETEEAPADTTVPPSERPIEDRPMVDAAKRLMSLLGRPKKKLPD